MAERGPWRDRFGWMVSCLQLQLGRQALVVLTLDAVLVGIGLLEALTSVDPAGEGVYIGVVLVPLVALGIPALADLVALERRAGCLDLALAAPAGERYFLRRAGVVAGLLAAQGAVVMGVCWLATGLAFPLLTVEAQLLAVTAFVAAATVFWAVRLASVGSVWLAATASVLGAGRWSFWLPVVTPTPLQPRVGPLLPSPWGTWEWATRAVPLAVAAALLLLYARRRLRRPEAILGAG